MHEQQKPARKKSQGTAEAAAGLDKTTAQPAEPAQQAQQQQPEASRPRASPLGSASVASGTLHSSTPEATTPSATIKAPSSQAAAVVPPQKQQQQQRQAAAARPAPVAGTPQGPPRQGGATPRGARPVPNYSAAVSGLVQNTSTLSISDTADPASVADPPNGAAAAAVQQAGTKRASATAAPPATTAAATSASHQHRRQQQGQQQQQQGRQVLRKPQQAAPQQQPAPSSSASTAAPTATTAAATSNSHQQQRRQQQWQQQQQQHQQQGFMHHAGPSVGSQHLWGDLPTAAASIPQQARQLNLPGVDWSFQAPSGAASGGPGALGFSRTASSGNLASQSAWPAGQVPPGAAAMAGRNGITFDGHTPGSAGDQLHQQQQQSQMQQQGQAGASSRASTSGFVVASSPGRAGQGNNRGQAGGSVRPSAGILSVQMNIVGQPRPSASHVMPTGGPPGGQAPYTGMGSAGQSMGVSLPSSIANNIWAVGDGKTDSLGTSADQRPDMWASPSRSSPVRRAGGYNGPGAAQLPSLSHASEIRRVAEASGLCCPITKDLMSDPVVLISDGYTYERAAITKWLEQNETSPITEAALQHKDMVPNLTMRSAIQLLIPSANSQRLFPSQLERRHI